MSEERSSAGSGDRYSHAGDAVRDRVKEEGAEAAPTPAEPRTEPRTDGVIRIREKGRRNGVASLDETGSVPESQLPARLTEVRQPTISVDELAYPLYIPHRGGANIAPENTIDALRAAVELGFKLVEVDCSRLRDGGLMVMHDNTPDRTSNLHGPPDRLLTQAVLRGRISAGEWFSSSWPSDLVIPALSDVLREVGNHICVLIEAKNAGSGAAAVDLVLRSELGHTVIVQSFRRGELDAAIKAGLQAGLVHETGDVDPVTLRAEGIDYLAVCRDAPAAHVTAAVEAGLTVFVYDVDRRHDHDRLATLGVDGFITDDPMYVSRRLPAFTSDPYVAQTFWHGCLPSAAGARGYFTPPDWWGYGPDWASGRGGPETVTDGSEADDPEADCAARATPAGGYQGALQGWACPVAVPTPGDPDGHAATVGFDLVVDAVRDGDTSRWASIFFGAPDDRAFRDDGHADAPDGYHALLRADGQLALYRLTAGAAAPLSATRTPPLELGQTVARLEVRLAPGEVAVARTDVRPVALVRAADTAHRGGYFHLGRDGADVRFRDVIIT